MLKRFYPVIFLAEILFLIVSWPYLSGDYAYAPKSILGEGTFSASNWYDSPLAKRDYQGQRDYFDQERVFLRFYRESIRKGELPFWNEKVFGGTSQEDSMIYSYLSPFNLPWLFIDDDHVAKGVQIFILLNFALFGILLWCNILNLSNPWSLMVVVLATLTPLALHFLAHTHQPGIYFCGIYVTGFAHLFLEKGKTRYLILFCIFLALAVIINFLSILLFIVLFVGIISATHLGRNINDLKVITRRIVFMLLCSGLVFLITSPFFGPILLESHLVREPVISSLRSYAPWSSSGQLVSFFAVFNPFLVAYNPFLIILPLLLGYAVLEYKGSRFPTVVLAIVIWVLLAFGITGFENLQHIFRQIMPGIKYSGNALFRMLFWSNIFAVLLTGWLSGQHRKDGLKSKQISILSLLCLVILVNLVLWSLTVFPQSWQNLSDVIHISALHQLVSLIYDRPERFYSTGFGFAASLSFFVFWYLQSRSNNDKKYRRLKMIAVFIFGICYATIYQYQRPNLTSAYDVIKNPIFAGLNITTDSRAITLENCRDNHRSLYRCEATLAGFKTFDGPTDTGLFINTRKFWQTLNDITEFNQKGLNIQEVNWLCSERIIKPNNEFEPGIKRFLRALGVEYIFTDRIFTDRDIVLEKQAGQLKLYKLSNVWKDITFFPGLDAASFFKMMHGLIRGEKESIHTFNQIDRNKQELQITRISALRWSVSFPDQMSMNPGVLFMNHPVEYHNDYTFPFTDLPLEGYWMISGNGKIAEKVFPLTDLPFRYIEVLPFKKIEIFYSYRHYIGWSCISITGLVFLIFMISWYAHTFAKESSYEP